MKINQTTVTWGLIGVAGAYVLGKYMIKDTAEGVTKAIDTNLNPTRQSNIANRAFSAVYSGGLDGQGTLGTDIYDGVQAVKQWFGQLTGPITIVDKPPSEASVLPNSWGRDTPGPSGRESVTKEEFNLKRTM